MRNAPPFDRAAHDIAHHDLSLTRWIAARIAASDKAARVI
jgi:hypothetical protein